MAAHNPPLPPELADPSLYPDRLGDTLLSKRWVLDAMVKTVQAVEAEPVGHDKVELQPDIDESLSMIWDFSADHDVAMFLDRHQFPDLSFSLMEKTSSPRLVELCLGILANMATVDTLNLGLTEDHLSVLPRLAGSSDGPVAIQALRLLHTCLAAALPHLDADFRRSIAFIFSSSTNLELVTLAVRLMVRLLDNHEEQIPAWGEDTLIEGLLGEVPKTLAEDRSSFQDIIYICHLLSTDPVTAEALWCHHAMLLDVAETYINTHLDEEALPAADDLQTLTMLFFTLATLLQSQPDPRIATWLTRFSRCLDLLEPQSDSDHHKFLDSLQALRNLLDKSLDQ